MPDTGKLLMLLGLALVVIGALIWGLGRLGFHGMPGDVRYQSDHVRIYFPIATCIVLSVLLTLASWLWSWIGRK